MFRAKKKSIMQFSYNKKAVDISSLSLSTQGDKHMENHHCEFGVGWPFTNDKT